MVKLNIVVFGEARKLVAQERVFDSGREFIVRRRKKNKIK